MSNYLAKPTLIARKGYSSSALSGVTDFLKGVVTTGWGAAATYNQQKGALDAMRSGAGQPAPSSGAPSWLLPVALVGGAAVLFVVLKRRK